MKAILKIRLGILALAGAIGAAACTDAPGVVTPTPTLATVFFSSQLMAGGSTSRSFKVARAGETKVLFTSLLPDLESVVLVAIGTTDGTVCTPTTTVATKAGSTDSILTTNLTIGDYCISVTDSSGALTKTNDFSITVVIPAG
jgi:hypothetical protein